MSLLLQFGAGGIGRGFIAPLFSQAGWEVAFVELAPAMIDLLRERNAYTVWEVDDAEEVPLHIQGFRVIDGRDQEEVAKWVEKADIAATAVGLKGLLGLAMPLAQGIARRSQTLDILVCENGASAAEDLRQAIGSLGADPLMFGCVRTSIGRMTPAPRVGMDPLDVRVEPYRRLPVEKEAFRGPIPILPDLQAKEDFTLVLRQKLYLHNLSHAALAYRGIPMGVVDVPAAVANPWLNREMWRAGRESAKALGLVHGSSPQEVEAIEEECLEVLRDLEVRYGNRALADPLERVARDPIRKLAGDDRLVGAARLALDAGVEPLAIGEAILAACRYQCADDDPSAAEWPHLAAAGWQTALERTADLDEEEPLWALLDRLSAAGHGEALISS
jgi:mannitol-1-phosphate 5-dehydrogenase